MASPKLKIQGCIKKGVLTLSQEMDTKRKEHIKEYKEGAILDISFCLHKSERSGKQRRYYFRYLVKPLCEELWGETHKQSLDNMNDFLKKNFNPYYYTTPEGVEEVRGGSIEDEKTDRVEEIYTQIRRWAQAEHGIRLYKPNEAPDED